MTSKQWRGERETLLDMLRDMEFGAAMNMGPDDQVDRRLTIIKLRIADLDAKLELDAKIQ